MKRIGHGGDFFTAEETAAGPVLDVSANVNPLGMPEAARRAVVESLDLAERYPDPYCRALRAKLSGCLSVPAGWMLCGNGAADLIFRLTLAERPKHALLVAPSFSEYEAALRAAGCAPRFYALRAEEGFRLGKRFLEELTPETDFAVLCNPNNPTGQLIDPGLLREIAARCEQNGARLLVDECFNGFLDDPERNSLIGLLGERSRLVLLRAFTKIYAMPGLRLGYCLSSDGALLERMAESGPPWAVSSAAQAAGEAALSDRDYLERTRRMIAGERAFLAEGLAALGLEVYPPEANYVFFRWRGARGEPLSARLLRKGVLVRDCGNYRGLDSSFLRAAVRTRAENERVLAAVGGALWEAER